MRKLEVCHQARAGFGFLSRLFVLKLGQAIFPHQIDDGLNLFNIHKMVILPSLF